MRISDWSSDVCSSDLEVDSHRRAEHNATACGAVRLDRLAVERDHRRPVAVELQLEDAGIGGVDQPEPKSLAGPDGKGVGHLAVDRHRVADAAGQDRKSTRLNSSH